MPQKLYDINVFEYQHPADKAALDAVKKAPGFNKLGEILAEIESEYNDRILWLGSYIRLTNNNAPHIIELFSEVCDTLGFDRKCELYSYKAYSYRLDVGGIQSLLIRIPDIMLQRFTDDQFRFVFGQVVTILKGNMLPMFSLTKNIRNIPLISEAMKPMIGQWRRKAQLTIDRGGLLACQDFDLSMKYLILSAGLPYRMLNEVNYYDYVDEISKTYSSKNDLAKTVGKLTQTVLSDRGAWSNERIVELFNWHESGQYQTIIARHT